MPFIPHTEDDIQAMLAEIGVKSIDALFDEIPAELKKTSLDKIPDGLTEMEVARLMQERAAKNSLGLCFIGAGAYEHHIPAAVTDIVSRGEFYTSYTPYQAEASQGTLQLLYEFQTMIANLTGMEVANASLYDGATALAEAILMAIRLAKKSSAKKILVPKTLNPAYRKVIKSLVEPQNIHLQEIPCTKEGYLPPEMLQQYANENIAALIIPQPNFFGNLEEVDALTDWAHQQNALAIAVVNPLAMALFKEPGSWGTQGADIVCGEAQPLGIPLASGGPYLGFLACREEYVRQMPGRIVGRTVDVEGKAAFTLTLQAREQHIRRSKATSNICTNQGLMVTAATIYMSLLGAEGLKRVAIASHQNAIKLQQMFTDISGVEKIFSRPYFHEFVIRLQKPATKILPALANEGIQGGYMLTQDYLELGECILVCATETKTEKDLEMYRDKLVHVG